MFFYLSFVVQISYTQNFEHRIVAGSKNDFMLVQYYKIKGTNKEIGKEIARIAKSLQIEIEVISDTVRNKLRYKYFKENYPIHYERMMGVAEEYGLNINDYSMDLSSISYDPTKANCAVIFYPNDQTENKHDIMSRNMDMPNDIIKNGLHIYARPIIFNVYPETGYPSLYICTNDILGGALEGINSKGLSVAVLGDETSNYKYHPVEPSYEIGINEFLIVRYLLDNCKNIEEAKESLLWLKQYYQQFPLHYIIADNTGKSFVFEFSRHRNQSRIVEGEGIQCITNHVISNNDLSDATQESIERLNILKSQIIPKHKYTVDEITKVSSKVSPWMPDYLPKWHSSRTFWHSIYDLDSKTLNIKFYLGEKKNPHDENKIITRYSDYIEFRFDD
jgi:predicted choloylglycine hydrolase